MERGEVWWAELPGPAGRRPVVLVSRPETYRVRTHVTVVPITRTIRRIRSHVVLGTAEGLPADSAANADDIITIPRRLLTSRITSLPPEKMAELREAIVFALALEDPGF